MEVKRENKKAKKVMNLRKDANFLLVTILWSNVSINVLLALLSESILAGVSAFLFSTVVITIVGEILPQAYFTRRALTVAAFLSPLIRVYQIILYPVAKPTAWVLDQWLGKEGIEYFKERDLEELIAMHMEAADTEIQKVEGLGAMNFFWPWMRTIFFAILSYIPRRTGEWNPAIRRLSYRKGKPPLARSCPFLSLEVRTGRTTSSKKMWFCSGVMNEELLLAPIF